MISEETCRLIDRFVLRLVQDSTPQRTAWNQEQIRQGKPSTWNYIDGCMLTALLSLSEITGDPSWANFVESVADDFISEEGAIRTFQPEKHTLDDINEGRILFPLWHATGKEKYRKAADVLHSALEAQPRTAEGSFWHKEIYPNQVWLDGLYMAQPFAALYEKTFGSGDYSDILHQLETVVSHMRDPKTGLYYHGWDSSRSAFWAYPETGLSQNFWLRAIGWFAVALADLAEILPAGPEATRVAEILCRLMTDVLPFSEDATGMYYQVVDQPEAPGNYLETSGSSMLAYAMLKGARLGILDPGFARAGEKTFAGIVDRYLTVNANGQLNLGGICLVAGLGPESNRRRDGSLVYYLSEPIVENDAKGIAPFLLCYTEILRLMK